jgi:hypothetical protein
MLRSALVRWLMILTVVMSAVQCNAGAAQEQSRSSRQLRIGDTLPIQGSSASIVFDAVTSDSRCAKGARCVRAGEAVVVLMIREQGRPATPVTLRVPPDDGVSGTIEGYHIEILRLDPAAETEKEIARSDYVLTLRVGR